MLSLDDIYLFSFQNIFFTLSNQWLFNFSHFIRSIFSSLQSHGVAIHWISSIIWQPIFSKMARDTKLFLFTHAVTPQPNSAICLNSDRTTNVARPRFWCSFSVCNVPNGLVWNLLTCINGETIKKYWTYNNLHKGTYWNANDISSLAFLVKIPQLGLNIARRCR